MTQPDRLIPIHTLVNTSPHDYDSPQIRYPQFPHVANGGDDVNSEKETFVSRSPSPLATCGKPFATGASRGQLDGLAHELNLLGVHGAYNFVRRHRFEAVRQCWAELAQAVMRGDRITNPAGLLVWMIDQAEAVAGQEPE